MAVNLPPQYFEAESYYKKATIPSDKLDWLQKMWILLPKHKASEKLQAELKSRLSDLREEIERPKSSSKRATTGRFPRQGAAQIVISGPPNGGKSQLLANLTSAKPEIAPYPFTTRTPQAGMMVFENIRFQLIDTPPVTADQLDPATLAIIRHADACLLVASLSDDDCFFLIQGAIDRLVQSKTHLVRETPEGVEDWSVQHIRSLVVATNRDSKGATERLEVFQELAGDSLPIIAVDCITGTAMTELGKAIYKLADIIRIYPKKPGKPAEKEQPVTIRQGASVLDFASEIHGDLPNQLKAARVWGPSAPHDGQTVPKEHVLQDGDTVELQV